MIEFEVLQVLNVTNRGQFIFIKQIGPQCDFVIKKGAFLGNIELDEFLDVPRKVNEKGQQIEGIYIFKPKHEVDKSVIIEGSVLSLTYR